MTDGGTSRALPHRKIRVPCGAHDTCALIEGTGHALALPPTSVMRGSGHVCDAVDLDA